MNADTWMLLIFAVVMVVVVIAWAIQSSIDTVGDTVPFAEPVDD